jgi:signal transduction histidine kinase
MQERASQPAGGATLSAAPASPAEPAPRQQSAGRWSRLARYLRNLRDAETTPTQPKPSPIYLVLAIGFGVLLFLIWLTGYVAQEKINEISIKAGEQYNEYNRRLNLAREIKWSAANVIVESRLLMAKRDIRVPVPPYRVNYNSAKADLSKRIEDGRKLWGNNNLKDSFSPEEIKAWGEVELNARKFWESLGEIEQASKSAAYVPSSETARDVIRDALQADVTGGSTPEVAEPTPQYQPFAPPAVPEEYSGARSDLERAASKLAGEVIRVRDRTLDQYNKQQMKAASEVSNTSWMTFLIGLAFTVVSFALAQNQIHALRRTTRRAVEFEGRERSVTDSQRNFIVVINEKGELLRANKAFHNYSRTSEPELTLQDYRAVFAHMPEVSAFVSKALQNPDGSAEARERLEVKPRSFLKGAKGTNKHADARLFDVRVTPLRIENEPHGRVIVIDDVTESERQREENRRNRTLSAVGTITAQVAHELYNPIGAVKLNLELLEMQIKEDDDVKHTVGRLKRGVDHLSTIVMDLRYLTKPRDPERKPTDINKLLDEVCELANDRLERTRIRVARDYSTTVPEGDFDQQQLRKVFLNLLINAVEASPQNGEVKLRTRFLPRTSDDANPRLSKYRGALAISVIDRGSGMSPETKLRLFEAFYTTKRNGTGLGMMITQEIIKKHGGKIEVESEEGKGTTVSVYLPV